MNRPNRLFDAKQDAPSASVSPAKPPTPLAPPLGDDDDEDFIKPFGPRIWKKD